MAARLSSLSTGRTLLPRNIIFMSLVLICVRGWVNLYFNPIRLFCLLLLVTSFLPFEYALIAFHTYPQGGRNENTQPLYTVATRQPTGNNILSYCCLITKVMSIKNRQNWRGGAFIYSLCPATGACDIFSSDSINSAVISGQAHFYSPNECSKMLPAHKKCYTISM
jgi:hypothetical protein